jgi:hypothetical protein
MKRFSSFVLVAGSLAVSACGNPFSTTTSSMTVNLLIGSQRQLADCLGRFDDSNVDKYRGSDGSQWAWLKGADGMLSHYCRRDRNQQISAWKEASRNDGATHQVTFDSNDSPAVFRRLSQNNR